MVIRESIEIFKEDTSNEYFKKEIELLKSAGYVLYDQSDDYVCFYQTVTVVDSDSIINNKVK